MVEDIAIRKFAPKTQHDYVQRVKDFAAFLGRSPDLAQSEDVRGFRLHLAPSSAGAPKINATVSALRFFFNATLDRPDLAEHLSFMREPRKVPVVLSPEEVARFLLCHALERLSPVRGWVIPTGPPGSHARCGRALRACRDAARRAAPARSSRRS
jgi:site-specific recombinase XerD